MEAIRRQATRQEDAGGGGTRDKAKGSRMSEYTYTRCAWAGGTFSPVVLLCQFFDFGREIGFGVTYLRI